jgi:hypothetical protein
MRTSAIFVFPLLLSLAGCSLFKSKPPPPPPRPLYVSRTATLEITNGIGVAASVELPPGFAPDFDSPPMWLAQGLAIGVAGALDQKAVILGFHGDRFNQAATIARDFGPGAPNGRIVAVAASPDGLELATAVAAEDAPRLDLTVIDSISGGEGHSVASFDGSFRLVSLTWLDRTTIAILIKASDAATATTANTPAPTDSPSTLETAATANTGAGLYLVGISGIGSITHFDKIKCGLGRLSFSPSRRFAVSEGDRDTAPAVIDLRTQACAEIRVPQRIRILGWAPDSSAFLYAVGDRDGKNAGVYRFTVATGRRTLIAVSAAAAAFASDGTIVALGNSQLSWKRLAQKPDQPIKAEIALLNPLTAVVTINSLGFETPPTIFARSWMLLTPASDDAAIDTFVPESNALRRELIEYSYPARSAFVLASGRPAGPLSMSWSTNGRALAIVDSDGAHAKLTVLIPPQ